MRIGVYGGTFDPPHLGHMEAARAAVASLALDKLLLVPANLPPHKQLASNSATPEQRLEMAALVADGLLPDGKAQADDLELRRDGPSYTSDTLRAFHARYPEDELWLLMGTDMLLSLQDWHEPEVITALAGIAGFARNEDDSNVTLEAQAKYLADTFGAKVRIIPLPQVIELSSTQVRANCDGAGLWSPIYGYIIRHGLYGVQKDLTRLSDDELRACALSMVKAKRHKHILGVEEESVRLAQRWGADETMARRAGILHDCTKYWSREQHLACCAHYNIPLDDMERGAEKLLHAKTGAAVARYIFGEPDEVCNAIFSHTTGKGNMTLLDKILYTADYMEPNRDFPGVEELRAAAYEDLDRAVIMGCEMSVEEMMEKNRMVHPNTYAALETLKGGGA